MKSFILGTAGHIDHGKTTLVKALTGVDTDRLEEERRRGISIELGFAHMEAGGIRFGIVDVPGHERFVKNMLAGAGGIDIVMLVVAAEEGVMPQTREHLDIVDFLGVEHGVVALTKCDACDEETLEIASLDVEEALEGTTLAGSPLVRVSGVTGFGLDDLRAALVRAAPEAPLRREDGPYRLPVDRVFTVEGFGTVVTGTGFSGSVRIGDRLELQPSGRTVRVRRVQVHGEDAERAGAGERTALALHGISREEVERGDQVVQPGAYAPSWMVDVRVRASPRWVRPIRNRERVRVHLASSEDLARLVLLDRDELSPGEDCLAQLRMETPIVPARGDRFVLRSYSPMVTMAGGRVLDPRPDKRRRHRPKELAALERREGESPSALVLEAVGERGLQGMKVKDLATACSLPADEARGLAREEEAAGNLRLTSSGRVVATDAWRVARRTVLERGAAYRERHPLRWGITREELRAQTGEGTPVSVLGELLEELAGEGLLSVRGEKVRVGGGEVVFEGAAAAERERIERAFADGGFSPPSREDVLAGGTDPGLGAEIVAALLDGGTLVKLSEEILYHERSWERALETVREIHSREGAIAVGSVRDRLDISRKFAVPLLEAMDDRRITRRDGDVRALLGAGAAQRKR